MCSVMYNVERNKIQEKYEREDVSKLLTGSVCSSKYWCVSCSKDEKVLLYSV